jgi:beta-1,4-mannosyl-glycoprotein beta-1,4-N-acetylglucosaminyltransferase
MPCNPSYHTAITHSLVCTPHQFYELDLHVDFFIICESNSTHTGLPKPTLFAAHRDRFARFAHKIRYMIVSLPVAKCGQWPWVCENYQRDALLGAFRDAGGRPSDVVIVSDADEIPRASTGGRSW